MISLDFQIPKAYWWSQNKRGHWQAKWQHTSRVKELAYYTACAWRNDSTNHAVFKQMRAMSPVHVTATIHPLTAGRFDPENAAPMVKAILDALTQADYWEDDDSRHVIGPDYRAGERSTFPDTYRINIRIEEVRNE